MAEEDPPFRIVYGDEYLAVIDKSADLVVHPAPSHVGATLVELLGDELAGGDDPERPGIVHRLDRGTSGLLVVAREARAHAALQAMIRDRSFDRIYIGLADRMAVNGAGSREARTHFEVVETLRRDSLLELRLETGRTHQIRVHLEAVGHPLVGDRTYGGPERYGLERQFLHSARIRFRHPVSGEQLDLSAGLPDDLSTALAAARDATG
jgi:23S rRNA pseudouridine1911/1915/1917 synthase